MDPALTGLLGVIIGAAVPMIIHRIDRKDRFALAIMKERILASQQAYQISQDMSTVLFESEKQSDVLLKARNWYAKNCLYLPPDIRQQFNEVIVKVSQYEMLWDAHYSMRHIDKNEQKERLQQKLNDSLSQIKTLSSRIQKNIDSRYRVL